ncbi:MAG: hypothetical protein HY553_03715 [Elusimicrobia bacterium]|nr:hypothetical protein [Elusimicrobiota bacterium]
MSETMTTAPYELVERHMHAGTVRRGAEELRRRCAGDTRDQAARYGLGVLEFLGAFERVSQLAYGYGIADGLARRFMPWLEMIPRNPEPSDVSYDDLRNIVEGFLADLRRADDAFSGVTDPKLRLPLRLGPGRLDLDGDGVPERPLAQWLGTLAPSETSHLDPELLVKFDRGDASWFRGYCRLMMGLAEAVLAYDHRELFETAGYLLFPRAVPANPKLGETTGFERFADAIALVHLTRFPLRDANRLSAALAHFEAAVGFDLEVWDFAGAQQESDHEWLPAPHQQGALGVRVTSEMVAAWRTLLLTAREILAGRLLIPHPRGNLAINVRRVFLQPRAFDLVLWIQGLAAVPYRESGPTVTREVAARLERAFGGRTLAFGLWFN